MFYFSIEEQQSRFGPIIIKPDAEVEAFRERIYQKIPSVIYLNTIEFFLLQNTYENFKF